MARLKIQSLTRLAVNWSMRSPQRACFEYDVHDVEKKVAVAAVHLHTKINISRTLDHEFVKPG